VIPVYLLKKGFIYNIKKHFKIFRGSFLDEIIQKG
jgi:hypothetical protein